MSIFTNTSGINSGENIATEILAYLLSPKNRFIPFQKLFYQRIFGSPICFKEDQDIAIKTQSRFAVGQPDMMALANDSLLIFENKLSSFLSGNDQLIRYSEIFDNEKSIHEIFDISPRDSIDIINRYLVLIAPSRIINIAVCQTEEYAQRKFNKSFSQYCSDRKINFVEIKWEEILSDVDINNALQNELYLFVNNYLYKELNEEEIMILKDKNVPSALNKLFVTIQILGSRLDIDDYRKEGKIGQSYNYYGFYIKHKYFKSWFGYFLPLWEKYKTPVFLQIKEDWIDDEKKEEIIKLLDENNHKKEAEHGYILPFYVKDIENWKNDLSKILTKFSEKLS